MFVGEYVCVVVGVLREEVEVNVDIGYLEVVVVFDLVVGDSGVGVDVLIVEEIELEVVFVVGLLFL